LYQFYSQLQAHSSPSTAKGFFNKFWWDEEIMEICWQTPTQHNLSYISRAKYRKQLKDKQIYSTEVYTNDLHEAQYYK